MRVASALLLSILALAACSKKDDNKNATSPVQSSGVVAPVTPQPVTATGTTPVSPTTPSTASAPLPVTDPTMGSVLTKTVFTCADKTSFAAQFESGPNQVRITFPKLAPIVLAQEYVASGFWYKSAQIELRGKGRDGRLTITGRAPVYCTAAP